MKTLALETKRTCYLVVKNEDGTLSIKTSSDGSNIPNIGSFIVNMGGIEGVLARCEEFEGSYDEFLESRDLNIKAEQAEMRMKHQDKEKETADKIANLLKLDVIPATVENVQLLLKHLNTQNWGSWTLPQMSIGYSANQFDCEGVTATTIKLDKPISSEEFGIENERMFKTGGKRGHLPKYQRL